MSLALDGAVDITGADGSSIRLRGAGSSIEVDVEPARSGPAARWTRARRVLPLVRLAAIALERAGLTAHVRVGRRLITLGRGVNVDPLARIFRLPHTRLR